MGKSSINGHFNIAILVYQRVNGRVIMETHMENMEVCGCGQLVKEQQMLRGNVLCWQ